jgi:hypothetical protein
VFINFIDMHKSIQLPQYTNILQYPQPTIQTFPSFSFSDTPQISTFTFVIGLILVYGTYVKSADGQTVPVSFNSGFAFPTHVNQGGYATINTYPAWYPAPYYG